MIVCADLHLRLDVPICRNETEEEWLRLQRKTLHALKGDKPIVIAGDIFHRPVSSPKLVNLFLSMMKGEDVFIMPGNHDLQARNPDVTGTSYGTIEHSCYSIASRWSMIPYGGTKIEGGADKSILFMHRYVVESPTDIIPGMDAISAHDLLALYPDYKLIVAGDNHSGFIYREKDRTVLVPGAMTRQSANATDKMPFMYYIDDHLNIEPIALPDCEAILSREHLDKDNEREARLTAFIESLKKGEEVTLDFEENVAMALLKNKLREETEAMVKELVYG